MNNHSFSISGKRAREIMCPGALLKIKSFQEKNFLIFCEQKYEFSMNKKYEFSMNKITRLARQISGRSFLMPDEDHPGPDPASTHPRASYQLWSCELQHRLERATIWELRAAPRTYRSCAERESWNPHCTRQLRAVKI